MLAWYIHLALSVLLCAFSAAKSALISTSGHPQAPTAFEVAILLAGFASSVLFIWRELHAPISTRPIQGLTGKSKAGASAHTRRAALPDAEPDDVSAPTGRMTQVAP